MQIKDSVIVKSYSPMLTELSEVAMPWSAGRTLTDPDEHFAGIRSLRIEGLAARRSEFCVEATLIDR